VSDQPLPELLDSIPDMVFLAITFGSVVGMEVSLVLTYAASDPIPPELCSYSAAALLRAYYPFDGGSPTEVPSLRISLLFFLRGAVGVVIAPAPLGGDREPTFAAALDVITYSFPLPEPELVPTPLWPLAASVLGICKTCDASLTSRTVTSMSSSMGISFSSMDQTIWSMKIGKQDDGGLMRSPEIESELNFDNILSNTFISRSVPWPCSSRVASFSSVYIQGVRAHYWMGAMHQDKKSDGTISDVKPFSTRNRILLSTGS
jgi:hypothetical protein